MAPRLILLFVLVIKGFSSVKCNVSKASEQTGLYFTQQPEDVVAVKNKPLILPCSAESAKGRQLTWQWFCNDLPVVLDDRRQVLSNGSLYFKTIKHKANRYSDGGEYRCVIGDGDGFLSSIYVLVKVAGVPEFTEHPENQNFTEGTHGRMSCVAQSSPDAVITWEKEGSALAPWPNKFLSLSGPGFPGSVLYILNLELSDAGEYRCVATNPLNQIKRKSKTGVLTVTPPETPSESRFLTPSREMVVKEGDTAVLDCVANGFPPRLMLHWTYRSPAKFKPISMFDSSLTGHSINYLTNVKSYQSGDYACSLGGESEKSIVIDLKVMKPPEIIERPKSVTYQAAKLVRFYCTAIGDPMPAITWMKDGVPIQIGGRISQNTKANTSLGIRLDELVVASSLARDAGIYQCLARSAIGADWSATRLILNSTKVGPRPPENVTCETISSTDIRVDWDVDPEVKLGGLQAFSVHYYDIDGGEELRDAVPRENRSYIVRSLEPYTNYTFYVRSYRQAASDFSNQPICQTEEEVPEGAPEVHLINSTSNSLLIYWTPLDKKEARGEVVEYKIEWRLSGGKSVPFDRVDSNVLHYTITDLLPNRNYEVRVLAATRKGWPRRDFPWKLFKVYERSQSEELPVPILMLEALNSSVVKVEWGVPEEANVKFQGYKLFFGKENVYSYPTIFEFNVTEFYMTDLDPETMYEVTVVTFLGLEEGKPVSKTVKTLPSHYYYPENTLSHVPAVMAPTTLEARPTDSGLVILTWNPPPRGDINIVDYTVCYCPAENSAPRSRSSVTCFQSSGTRALINDLEPSRVYEFSVRANGEGNVKSNFTRSVECCATDDVPSQVIDIRWKPENKTAVLVVWKKPERSNGFLRNYTIFYTEDPSLPLFLWETKVVSANTYATHLTGLSGNTEYFMVIRAATSAGFGLYEKPKKIIIPVLVQTPTKNSSKSEKDRRNEQYMGIIVGSGIGLSCIVICIVFTICRRRCVKNHVVEEIEQTSGRGTNGTVRYTECDRRVESQETEFFPHTLLQNSRTDETLVERHYDKKDRPNGFSNGFQGGLPDAKSQKNSPHKEDIIPYSVEHVKCDGSHVLSPLLVSSCDGPDATVDSDALNQSTVPLLSGTREFSDGEFRGKTNPEDSKPRKEATASSALPALEKGNNYTSKPDRIVVTDNNEQLLKQINGKSSVVKISHRSETGKRRDSFPSSRVFREEAVVTSVLEKPGIDPDPPGVLHGYYWVSDKFGHVADEKSEKLEWVRRCAAQTDPIACSPGKRGTISLCLLGDPPVTISLENHGELTAQPSKCSNYPPESTCGKIIAHDDKLNSHQINLSHSIVLEGRENITQKKVKKEENLNTHLSEDTRLESTNYASMKKKEELERYQDCSWFQTKSNKEDLISKLSQVEAPVSPEFEVNDFDLGMHFANRNIPPWGDEYLEVFDDEDFHSEWGDRFGEKENYIYPSDENSMYFNHKLKEDGIFELNNYDNYTMKKTDSYDNMKVITSTSLSDIIPISYQEQVNNLNYNLEIFNKIKNEVKDDSVSNEYLMNEEEVSDLGIGREEVIEAEIHNESRNGSDEKVEEGKDKVSDLETPRGGILEEAPMSNDTEESKIGSNVTFTEMQDDLPPRITKDENTVEISNAMETKKAELKLNLTKTPFDNRIINLPTPELDFMELVDYINNEMLPNSGDTTPTLGCSQLSNSNANMPLRESPPNTVTTAPTKQLPPQENPSPPGSQGSYNNPATLKAVNSVKKRNNSLNTINSEDISESLSIAERIKIGSTRKRSNRFSLENLEPSEDLENLEEDSDYSEDDYERIPRKKRRRSKSINSDSASSRSYGPQDSYRERRDKNNEASRRSRQNKKDKERMMYKSREEAERKNAVLKARADKLEKLVTYLRQLLLQVVLKKGSRF